MKAGNRIISNTLILYVSIIVSMLISLYSVRLVLSALGAVDYGIFNVVMGVVSMLSFLNAALTVSTQRFLSFYQGANDRKKIVDTFNHSLLLHIIIGLLLMFLLCGIGGFIIDNYLQIPADRMETAKIIFLCSSVAVFFTFISVPYVAVINANEKMVIIASVSVFEALSKLVLAVHLTLAEGDLLLVYGICMGLITVFSFVIYYVTCFRFDECRHVSLRNINGRLMRELGSFAGWNIIGSVTGLSKNQGIAVLFNMFQGSAVNAAYAVAYQASANLNIFSATMLRAVNPQIMKSEGAGNHERMLYLSNMACKYGFLLLAVFALPCIFEMHNIIGLWLKEVPEYTVLFSRLILLAMMADQLTVGLDSAFKSCNFVRHSAIYVGVVKLTILPLGYVLLKLQMSVYWIVILYALVELLAGAVRIILSKRLMGLHISAYFREVPLRLVLPMVITGCVCALGIKNMSSEFRLFITLPLAAIVFCITAYRCSLQDTERMFVKTYMKESINKLRHGKNSLNH